MLPALPRGIISRPAAVFNFISTRRTFVSSSTTQKQNKNLADVQRIVAVASCKGGVGKSSVAVNLAYMLSKLGKRVGLLDVDIYGPSLPFQIPSPSSSSSSRAEELGTTASPSPSWNVTATPQGDILPVIHDNVKLMSLGFVRPNEYAALRGPIVSGIVQQLLTQTSWGELDFLLLDLPPGTGDIHLTVAQTVPVERDKWVKHLRKSHTHTPTPYVWLRAVISIAPPRTFF